MRILVLGAGGTGGYFGGRLAQAGGDVSFLVRPTRAAQLAADGLWIRSPLGDARLRVAHLTAEQLPAAARRPFEMILLSCKAYDLDSSIEAIAPAMGEATSLWPILNGLAHYDSLDRRFGASRVLGGVCFISATKNAEGDIVHLGGSASVTFGERAGAVDSARCQALADSCADAGIEHVYSRQIAQDIWIKYSFLCALAAGTCLMRATVGQIVGSEGGAAFMRDLYGECVAVATASDQPIPAPAQRQALQQLTQARSPVTASMLRDLQAGQRIEAWQIVGDMLGRARAAGQHAPLLALAWCQLQAYQAAQTSSVSK